VCLSDVTEIVLAAKQLVSKSTSAAHSINDRMNEFTTRQENSTNTYRGQPNQLLVFSASRLAFSKKRFIKGNLPGGLLMSEGNKWAQNAKQHCMCSCLVGMYKML